MLEDILEFSYSIHGEIDIELSEIFSLSEINFFSQFEEQNDAFTSFSKTSKIEILDWISIPENERIIIISALFELLDSPDTEERKKGLLALHYIVFGCT